MGIPTTIPIQPIPHGICRICREPQPVHPDGRVATHYQPQRPGFPEADVCRGSYMPAAEPAAPDPAETLATLRRRLRGYSFATVLRELEGRGVAHSVATGIFRTLAEAGVIEFPTPPPQW